MRCRSSQFPGTLQRKMFQFARISVDSLGFAWTAWASNWPARSPPCRQCRQLYLTAHAATSRVTGGSRADGMASSSGCGLDSGLSILLLFGFVVGDPRLIELPVTGKRRNSAVELGELQTLGGCWTIPDSEAESKFKIIAHRCGGGSGRLRDRRAEIADENSAGREYGCGLSARGGVGARV